MIIEEKLDNEFVVPLNNMEELEEYIKSGIDEEKTHCKHAIKRVIKRISNEQNIK